MPSGRTADFSYTDSNNPGPGAVPAGAATAPESRAILVGCRPDPATGHTGEAVTPPVPERRPVELEAHGDVRVDDWFWLRDKDDPAVIDHLRAENAYTEVTMAGTEDLRAALFEEMVARIEETDLSVPVRKGPWLYYSRTMEGSSYAIHCRRPVPPGWRPAGPQTVGAEARGPRRGADHPGRERARPGSRLLRRSGTCR